MEFRTSVALVLVEASGAAVVVLEKRPTALRY